MDLLSTTAQVQYQVRMGFTPYTINQFYSSMFAIILIFSDIVFEHLERKIFFSPYLIELLPLFGAPATSESSCWDLACGGGSSLTRPLKGKEIVIFDNSH